MSLNRQGPGKIDWTDWTWNPIAGCLHGCEYCYIDRMQKRFWGSMMPTYRPGWLRSDLVTMQRLPASKIFIGSSGDMWGDWVPADWIQSVLEVVTRLPQHTFQFLTKNPRRYSEFNISYPNTWYGTTDDGTTRTEGNISDLVEHAQVPGGGRFVSFEPLLEEVIPELFGIQWVIIGADSTPGAARPPDKWADLIMYEAMMRGIPVWVKDNYRYPEKMKTAPPASRPSWPDSGFKPFGEK